MARINRGRRRFFTREIQNRCEGPFKFFPGTSVYQKLASSLRDDSANDEAGFSFFAGFPILPFFVISVWPPSGREPEGFNFFKSTVRARAW
jgi:hypothetical protein